MHSRSGTALTRRRGTLAVRRWAILQFALLAVVGVSFANYDVLMREVRGVDRAASERARTSGDLERCTVGSPAIFR